LIFTFIEPFGPLTVTVFPRHRWSVMALQSHQEAYHDALPVIEVDDGPRDCLCGFVLPISLVGDGGATGVKKSTI
jgi:hypothetical protein